MLTVICRWPAAAFPRCFKRQLSLAYQLHAPSDSEAARPALIILHGLFGSKQNNRSISKYGLLTYVLGPKAKSFRILAQDLRAKVYALVCKSLWPTCRLFS